ncbi:hypothetical protein [Nicoliella lavandulae]|uniref:Uncharacterized protein n=1 Tax=Nicoliella lavandulae TaxID=3082954 RepID=A0ABU8SN93_9LACO
MTEQSKETKNSNDLAATQLDLMTKNRTVKKVSYQDLEGTDHEVEAALKDPGDFYLAQAIDMVQSADDTSDYVGLYSLIMDKVLLSPRLTYRYENEQLKKAKADVRKHTITATDKNDNEIHLVVKVPTYERLVNLIFMSTRPSSATNITGLVTELANGVLYDMNDNKIDNDFWEYGKPGNGFMMSVINETLSYLQNVANRDGFLSVMNAGITFLTQKG